MLKRSSKSFNSNFRIKRKYSSTLCVCFLFTRHCLRPRHNARRALLLPDLQQWHVWCLLQNRGRPDRCNYLPLRHHGGVSDWSHGVSQDVETRSCAQIQGTVRPGGKSSARFTWLRCVCYFLIIIQKFFVRYKVMFCQQQKHFIFLDLQTGWSSIIFFLTDSNRSFANQSICTQDCNDWEINGRRLWIRSVRNSLCTVCIRTNV